MNKELFISLSIIIKLLIDDRQEEAKQENS